MLCHLGLAYTCSYTYIQLRACTYTSTYDQPVGVPESIARVTPTGAGPPVFRQIRPVVAWIGVKACGTATQCYYLAVVSVTE
jgi:hypothetical protein